MVGLAVLLGALYYFADLVSWSIQPLYKRRLSASFALRRVMGPDGKLTAEERPYSALYKLSDSQPAHLPKFLICAAVNVSDYGATATGSNVGGFVFGADEIGGPVTYPMPTTMYESAVGRRAGDFTLPAAMSISGAAISPSMGKMSRPPLRFLLALLNVRLGVWIPNPRRIWLANEIGDRYDRQLADDGKRQAFPINPRPSYLLRELFGRNHVDARFIYVSDGGHYENLGLVELLRRGCTTIWCVDASGEAIDTFGTIADAVAIARSELSVDIDIDPRVMSPTPRPRFAPPGSCAAPTWCAPSATTTGRWGRWCSSRRGCRRTHRSTCSRPIGGGSRSRATRRRTSSTPPSASTPTGRSGTSPPPGPSTTPRRRGPGPALPLREPPARPSGPPPGRAGRRRART